MLAIELYIFVFDMNIILRLSLLLLEQSHHQQIHTLTDYNVVSKCLIFHSDKEIDQFWKLFDCVCDWFSRFMSMAVQKYMEEAKLHKLEIDSFRADRLRPARSSLISMDCVAADSVRDKMKDVSEDFTLLKNRWMHAEVFAFQIVFFSSLACEPPTSD